MIYDESCFERHNERLEEEYLNKETMNTQEIHKCCAFGCNEEAVTTVNGDHYCAEHAQYVIREYWDLIEEISGYETFANDVPQMAGSEIETY